MTARIKRHAKTLSYLAECDKHNCKAIINAAGSELLNCFSDICYNVLKGKVSLSPTEENNLRKYKNILRKIADKKSTLKTKKTLVQKGGFLSALLGPLIESVLAPLAKGIFSGFRKR